MREAKTYGYNRRSQVPGDATPKLCPKCHRWYAPAWHQRVCDGCRRNTGKISLPAETRTYSPALGRRTREPDYVRIVAGQRVVKNGFVELFSDYLNLTFRCPLKDPRAARLETRVLALEDAARQRWEHKGHAPGERACALADHQVIA